MNKLIVVISLTVLLLVVLLVLSYWRSDSKLTTGERRRLQEYNRWGEELDSKDPERMRKVLGEMQRSGFSKKNVEEFKRLRDKSER